jgi:hypothetical protein
MGDPDYRPFRCLQAGDRLLPWLLVCEPRRSTYPFNSSSVATCAMLWAFSTSNPTLACGIRPISVFTGLVGEGVVGEFDVPSGHPGEAHPNFSDVKHFTSVRFCICCARRSEISGERPALNLACTTSALLQRRSGGPKPRDPLFRPPHRGHQARIGVNGLPLPPQPFRP